MWKCLSVIKKCDTNLLFVGQGRVDKLAVEDTGTLGIRGQEPDHKGNLKLKIKWKPSAKREKTNALIKQT